MNKLTVTIGITTYNRKNFLKEAINSILQQTHQNFKIIVGNDYTKEIINFKTLGMPIDERIIFINHNISLGELDNMNYLLRLCNSEWFTWLADDDLMHKDFLKNMLKNINNNDRILASYSNFSTGILFDTIKKNINETKIEKLNFKTFIQKYVSHKIKLIGCYGLIRTNILKKLGGHPKLGNSFGPYSDAILPILISSEGSILWEDTKLVFLRTHQNSLSVKSSNLEAYSSSEEDFIFIISKLMIANKFNKSFKNYIYYKLIVWFTHNTTNVLKRNKKINIIKKLLFFFRKKFLQDIKYISFKFKIIYTIKILYLAYKIF